MKITRREALKETALAAAAGLAGSCHPSTGNDLSQPTLKYAAAIFVRGRFPALQPPPELTKEEAEIVYRAVATGLNTRIKQRLHEQRRERRTCDSALSIWPNFLAEVEEHRKYFSELRKQSKRTRLSEDLLEQCFSVGYRAAAIADIDIAHSRHMEDYYRIIPY